MTPFVTLAAAWPAESSFAPVCFPVASRVQRSADVLIQLEQVAHGFALQSQPVFDATEYARIRSDSAFYNPALDSRVVSLLREKGSLADLAEDFQLAADALGQVVDTGDQVAAQAAALAINHLTHSLHDTAHVFLEVLSRAHQELRKACARSDIKLTHMRLTERADRQLVREYALRLAESGGCTPTPVRRHKHVRNVHRTSAPRGIDTAASQLLRPLLAGRKIILIGGLRDRERERDMSSVLGCDVEQVELFHGQSSTRLLPVLRDPAVACVAVAIRICKHETLPAVVKMARQFNLPVITLPSGFSVAQLGRGILEQAGDRLAMSQQPDGAA